MSDADSDTIRIQPTGEARSSVIWLHGLGADGNDFVPVVPELGLPDRAGVRFLFPHAPVRPVTLNGGMPMRAWFDITGLDATARLDREGIDQARSRVDGLIRAEVDAGIPPERVVVAGFSQGGAVALYAGLHYPETLAGIMGLSTWIGDADNVLGAAASANHRTSVFMAHGEQDPTVACEYGRMSCNALQEAGYSVEWHTYPMGHQVCLEQVREIGHWLQRVLGVG